MDSLGNILSDLRIFLYGGLRTLPITIAGTLMLIGMFTANYAILFFLLGFLILTPLVAYGLNLTAGPLLSSMFPLAFKVKTTDICKVLIPYTTLSNPVGMKEENVVFSSWLAMTSFFIAYLFTNATHLYNREIPEGISVTEESKVTVRKTQALVALGSILIAGFMLVGFRLYSGCESIYSVLLTFILFSIVGNIWYKVLASVGEDRLSDLFGIANRLLPPNAMEDAPIACIPIRT